MKRRTDRRLIATAIAVGAALISGCGHDPGNASMTGRTFPPLDGADVAVVVGTSSIVYPAAGLPELALANGTAVIEVNPERTPLSDAATVSLRETAAGALPRLLQRLPVLLG